MSFTTPTDAGSESGSADQYIRLKETAIWCLCLRTEPSKTLSFCGRYWKPAAAAQNTLGWSFEWVWVKKGGKLHSTTTF